MGAQGENKHLDPIFLLQFSSVQYMAEICAKFEKNHDCTSFSFKGSNLINSLELLIPKRLELFEVEF